MLLNPSFVSGTLEEAVESLAKLAADCRTRPLTLIEKQALAGSDALSAVGRFLSTPGGAALLGGGLGAAAGGIGTAFSNRGKPEGERRSILSSALTGGLAGAAIGGGGAAAAKGLQGLKNPEPAEVRGGPIAIPGSSLKLDPKVMKAMPDAHKRLQELAEPTWGEHVTGTLGKGVDAIREFLPVSSTVLPGVAAADYLTNTQTRFGGKMLGDKNWLHAPGAAAKWTAEKAQGLADKTGLGNVAEKTLGKLHNVGERMQQADWGVGMIDPRNSTNVSHLDTGIDTALAEPKRFPQFGTEAKSKLLQQLKNGKRPEMEEAARTRHPEHLKADVEVSREIQPDAKPQEVHHEVYNSKIDDWERHKTTTKDVYPPKRTETGWQTEILDPEQIKQLKAIGAQEQLGGMKEHAAPNASGIPRVRRGLFGGSHNVPGKVTSLSRLLPRLGLYLGGPTAEFVARSKMKEWDRTAERDKLIEQMRQNGLIAE